MPHSHLLFAPACILRLLDTTQYYLIPNALHVPRLYVCNHGDDDAQERWNDALPPSPKRKKPTEFISSSISFVISVLHLLTLVQTHLGR